MFCAKCGKKIPDDSHFCPFCGTKINLTGDEWIQGNGFIILKNKLDKPINQISQKSSKKVKLGYYDRPYCDECKLIYGKHSIGIILKCTKCGKPLVLKSFNPYPKIIGGILILILTISSFFIDAIPIIWIGGLFVGIRLISDSLSQWATIKKLDQVKYY